MRQSGHVSGNQSGIAEVLAFVFEYAVRHILRRKLFFINRKLRRTF